MVCIIIFTTVIGENKYQRSGSKVRLFFVYFEISKIGDAPLVCTHRIAAMGDTHG